MAGTLTNRFPPQICDNSRVTGGDQVLRLATALTENERDIVEKALAESGGLVGGATGAAARLGIPRQTLDSKIKMLGINKFRFKKP
jgi:transcriptional regulator with GAF, ATPase, and Fis domain